MVKTEIPDQRDLLETTASKDQALRDPKDHPDHPERQAALEHQAKMATMASQEALDPWVHQEMLGRKETPEGPETLEHQVVQETRERQDLALTALLPVLHPDTRLLSSSPSNADLLLSFIPVVHSYTQSQWPIRLVFVLLQWWPANSSSFFTLRRHQYTHEQTFNRFTFLF